MFRYYLDGNLSTESELSSVENREKWLQVTGIIQSIVTVSTLPLTSAVCSNAAVVFTQRRCATGGISLRQTMVLADKGWMDVQVYAQLLRGHWKRYGSAFLYIAIALNVLGRLRRAPFHTLTHALDRCYAIATTIYPFDEKNCSDSGFGTPGQECD